MAMGIMAYASALFWALFLVFSSAEVIVQSTTTPVYFSPQPSLFPLWPVWHPELTLALLTTTGVLLVLPKLLSYALILKRHEGAAFGGPGRLLLGIAMEIVFSTLMAPLRLWFHCKFVLLTLLGRQIKWNAQARNSETGWAEAVDQHGFATLLAVSWMAAAIYWNTALAWWLVPVSLPLMLAVPLSIYSSRLAVRAGNSKLAALSDSRRAYSAARGRAIATTLRGTGTRYTSPSTMFRLRPGNY
jgi:membrane glycosyltransferase